MAPKPCQACKARFKDKATSVYWAWMESGVRVAYRSQLCMDCVRSVVAPWVKRAVLRDFGTGCDQCGGTGPDDYELVYTTVYRPRVEAEQFELMFCSEDNDKLQYDVRNIAGVLPDRQPAGSRGPENTQDVTEAPW